MLCQKSMPNLSVERGVPRRPLTAASPLLEYVGRSKEHMKYDDASWHYGGSFPEGQPIENGGTHIALFLKWCFSKGWAGNLHLEQEQEPEAIQALVNGEMSATEFFFTYCDGKFIDEDLNDEGNTFASKYYGDNGLYLEDYAENFGELMYVAPESLHDFKKFSAMLDARFASGLLEKASDEE